ncbi:MAG: hypothetical protein KKH98_01030, partial [Spirochaetes bacterium]|nr:hypothetical protein [Spirochaetota bacterium]
IFHILLILFILTGLQAADSDRSISGSEKTFQYAKTLFNKKDHYRSITEFKRYLFFGGDRKKREESQYYIGLNYLNAKDYRNARENFFTIYESADHSQRERALLRIADSYLFEEADSITQIEHHYFFPLQFRYDYYIQYLKEYNQGDPYYKEAHTKLIMTHILNFDKYRSLYLINNTPSKIKENSSVFNDLNSKALLMDDIPQRSETLATVFSVIIPGLGQIYAGEVKEGFIALMVNALFGYSAYYTYVNYSKLLGILIGYYELTFYYGNIVNAGNAVAVYNENRKNEFRQEVLKLNF